MEEDVFGSIAYDKLFYIVPVYSPMKPPRATFGESSRATSGTFSRDGSSTFSSTMSHFNA